jgi:hypothetical protein
MAEVKPPTVRSVKAALRKADFPEAVLRGRPGTMDGMRSGWHVSETAGEIRVSHWDIGMSRAGLATALIPYAGALRGAGWRVIEDEQGGFLAVLAAAQEKENGNGE